jgi:hypothetical protein
MVNRMFAVRPADPPAGRRKIAIADDDGAPGGWNAA